METKKLNEPRTYMIDIGNSTTGQIGAVVRVEAISPQAALDACMFILNELHVPVEGGEVALYFNTDRITLADVHPEESALPAEEDPSLVSVIVQFSELCLYSVPVRVTRKQAAELLVDRFNGSAEPMEAIFDLIEEQVPEWSRECLDAVEDRSWSGAYLGDTPKGADPR